MRSKFLQSLSAAVGVSLVVGGCVSPQRPLQADYGYAVRQTLVSQTADPEAKYLRKVEPASNGARAALANKRYVKGQVIQPPMQSTSMVNGSAGAASGAPAGDM